MSKTPYRIIYYSKMDDPYQTWEFDETEFETAETAYDYALTNYSYCAFRIVKLCYPKED